MLQKTTLQEKFRESLSSVLPVSLIVLVLCFTYVRISSGMFLSFLLGTLMLIVGMTLFNIGADSSMSAMGEYVGAQITHTKKLWIILPISFLVGVMITVSEPDLQVLAGYVTSIDKTLLIWGVGTGVGIFLAIAMLRIFFGIKLQYLLWGFYILLFTLAAFVPAGFWAVAFDSGGVTTGPMTVPFIMALGIGVSSIRSDKGADSDSFGLVSLCSIGPIAAVLLLGLFSSGTPQPPAASAIPPSTTTELSLFYLKALPGYMKEVAVSVAPIVVFFLIFSSITRKRAPVKLGRIMVGALYTTVGLIIFLTGANVGFAPLGRELGLAMASNDAGKWVIIPIGMLIGFFVVKAEPAVHVLTKQVNTITAGAVSETPICNTLCISVAVSVGLSFMRVLTGISILYLLIPGYAIALLLSLFVPDIFVSIAFDSGGVASGPMTAAFLLPLAIGACEAVGGNIATDAFGTVAMVAMTPLIAIQVLGGLSEIRRQRTMRETVTATARVRETVIRL